MHLVDVPQHIIQRGNNRQANFFAEEDYLFYLDRLREGAQKYGCSIHAYVLMTNHVHLLASAQRAYALSLMMQLVIEGSGLDIAVPQGPAPTETT